MNFMMKLEAGNDIKTCTDVETTAEVCFNLAHCRAQHSCLIIVIRKFNGS